MKRVIKNAHELKRETFCMLRVPAKLTDLMEDKLKPEPSILKPTKCACFGFSELGGQKELDEMNAVWKYKIMAHVPSLLCEGQGRKKKKKKKPVPFLLNREPSRKLQSLYSIQKRRSEWVHL